MIRILLVEDHELIRMGLSIMINKADDMKLIGQAENGLQGVDFAKQLSYNSLSLYKIILF